MKLSKRNKVKYDSQMTSIQSATSHGTKFYSFTLDDVISALESEDKNLFIIYELKRRGWNAINIEDLYGSDIIKKVFYLCVTDGKDILINDELVHPEEALEKYSTDELSSYIKKADNKFIASHITEYELNIPKGDDLNECVIQMLRSGEDVKRIFRDYKDLQLI